MRTLIAGLFAAALATGTMGAAPARADNSDLAKILAGAATLVIIGSVIKDQRKKTHAGTNSNAYSHAGNGNQAHKRPGNKGHRYDKRQHAKTVPAQCLRTIRTRKGQQNFFARPCLRQNMRNVERLPNACAFRINGGSFGKVGYDPRCLQRNGWQRG